MRVPSAWRATALAVSFVVATGLAIVGTTYASGTTSSTFGTPSRDVPKLLSKYSSLDVMSLVVFADEKSGDLWVTDANGTGPIRIAKTPKVIERDPAGWFPWVVYDGTRVGSGNTDIYMMSLLGDLEGVGKGRIRITDHPAADTDPSIVGLPSLIVQPGSVAPAQPVSPAAAIFGNPVLLFSSDRRAGHRGCGTEVFFEYLNLTGPQQVSECDRVDKVDPQFANPILDGVVFPANPGPSLDGGGLLFAYTGVSMRSSGSDIWVDDVELPGTPGPMAPTQVTDSGFAGHPTWAPNSMATLAPVTPYQPVGDFPITFADWGTPRVSLWTVAGAPPTMTLGDRKNVFGPEWYFGPLGPQCLLFERTATFRRVTVSYSCDGSITDLTSPTKFYPTGADWLGYPILT